MGSSSGSARRPTYGVFRRASRRRSMTHTKEVRADVAFQTKCGTACAPRVHHYKNVPGRKTDVCDSAWLQYLHAVGLLQGSFRPADEICAFRTVMRHRASLVEAASKHVQHM